MKERVKHLKRLVPDWSEMEKKVTLCKKWVQGKSELLPKFNERWKTTEQLMFEVGIVKSTDMTANNRKIPGGRWRMSSLHLGNVKKVRRGISRA